MALLPTIRSNWSVFNNDRPQFSWYSSSKSFLKVLLGNSQTTLQAKFVVQSPFAKVFISFQDNIDGHLAATWVWDFATSRGLKLKLHPNLANSFYILKIIGEDCDNIVANLLLLSPLISKGHYTTLTPFDRAIDLRQPTGLKQLLHVTFTRAFTSSLD